MINVALFGNTGLANGVFRKLIDNEKINLCCVYTRKLSGHFPYYPETELWSLSEQNNIRTFTGENVNNESTRAFLAESKIDYIIVASFDQIIKRETLNIPGLGIINFHPSLLPKYRGPSPISWSLINGERKTGITIHELTEKIDAGKVLYQESLEISPDDNLGILYMKLSKLAERMSFQLLEDISTIGLPLGNIQREDEMSYYSKSTEFMNIQLNDSVAQTINRYRAFMPFPKTRIKIDGSFYVVHDMAVTSDNTQMDNKILYDNKYRWIVDNQQIEVTVTPLVDHK
jgi:methionyl-tRNA formyltransferase